MIKTFALSLSIATLAVAAVPAQAKDAIQAISFADIDPSTPAGAKALKTRVARAVENVCGSYAGVNEWKDADEIAACRKAAMADIAPQVAALTGHAAPQLAAR